jgi:hypothetical protein
MWELMASAAELDQKQTVWRDMCHAFERIKGTKRLTALFRPSVRLSLV